MQKRIQYAAYGICMFLAAAVAAMVVLQACWRPENPHLMSEHPASGVPELWGFSAESVVNSGDAKALDALPGVGEAIAQRIIETREDLDGFRLPEDLMLVKGIGEKTFEKIMDTLDESLVPLKEAKD